MRCVAPAADQVYTTLRRSWQCNPGPCVPMRGTAWAVDIDDDKFIATWAPGHRKPVFEAGLCAAEYVDATGIGAGCPVRAADGALTVAEGGGVLAVLRRVPGRPLRADDPLDQQWWGSTLGAVHRSLRRFVHPALAKFDLAVVRHDGPHLSMEPWLRPAITETAASVRRIMVTDQLTYGVLHGTPEAADFRLDSSTGRVGLVCWSGAGTGPLLYDLATAVVAAGGLSAAASLVDGYLHAAPTPADECEAVLPALLRLRVVLRAGEVAARIHAGGGTPADHARLTRLAAMYATLT